MPFLSGLTTLVQLKWGLNGIVVGASSIPGVGLVAGTYTPMVAITIDVAALSTSEDSNSETNGEVVGLSEDLQSTGYELDDVVIVTPQDDSTVVALDSSDITACSSAWAESHNVDEDVANSDLFSSEPNE